MTGSHLYGNFDGLRAVAALMVMVMHFKTFDSIATGAPGVFLFFGLSGFLLYTGFLSIDRPDAVNIVAYLVRRVMRILPLYLCFLVVYVFLFKNWSPDLKWSFFLANATFIQAKMHLWTIRAELVYYSVLPLVFVGLYFLNSAVTRFTALVVIAILVTHWANDYYAMFFIGMAAVHARHWFNPRYGIAIAWIALGTTILLSSFYDWMKPLQLALGIEDRRFMYQYGHVFFPLAFLVLVGLSHKDSRVFSNHWVRAIGICGYGIYLWHPSRGNGWDHGRPASGSIRSAPTGRRCFLPSWGMC